jgi:DNA-binding protein HU-beta
MVTRRKDQAGTAQASDPDETTGYGGPRRSAQETITLRQIAETLAETYEMPRKEVASILEDMVGTVTKHLKRGARIRIGGLGVLQVRNRPARVGRNPATGEKIKIKASKKVAFRASKDLKESV